MLIGNKISLLKMIALTALLASCKPAENRLRSPAPDSPAQASPHVEQDLKPTWEESPDDLNGLVYEQPVKKIKNPQAEIIVGQVQMSHVKMNYNSTTRRIDITGIAKLIDDKKATIEEADFILSGSHAANQSSADLHPEKSVKSNSQDKPVIRAQATCLDSNDHDEYDCSHAVIDFYIAYKKQIFTQQMEVNKKPTIDKKGLQDAPVTTAPEAKNDDDPEEQIISSANEAAADVEAKNILPEGVEKSILGPYRGTGESVNLAEIFADDEGDIIAKETTEPDEKPAQTPPASGDTTKPTPKPPVKKPVPPTAPPKPSVPSEGDQTGAINKDFKQIGGEIRQINQSVGYADNGKLRNATSVLVRQQSLAVNNQAFFEVKTPANNNHYATYEMAKMIELLGSRMNTALARKLYVGSISFKNGGKISPHLSHQVGIDADLGYPTTLDGIKFPVVAANEVVAKASSDSKSKVITKYYKDRYSREKTYELLKFAFTQPEIKVERIFVDRTIKKALCEYATSQGEFKGPDKEAVQKLFENMEHVDGHGNHFHIRLRCSAEDPACRTKLYQKNNGCGQIK
ncbi:MAG: penicillin-insensitive murein endopeptidase [Bdellovibrio sp.]|nr:penicillin-insensitive murein endopeptidase [Bdellovibrio sp.]